MELLEGVVLPGDGPGQLLGPAERVQDPPLVAWAEQRLVLVLAVQVHEGAPQLPDHACRRGRSAHPGPVPPSGLDLPAEDQQPVLHPEAVLVGQRLDGGQAVDVEDGLDGGPLGSRPDDVGGGALAQEEGERAHDDGLPRPRLPREGVQARAEREGQVVDDGVVPDAEFDEHDPKPTECDKGASMRGRDTALTPAPAVAPPS